MKAKSKRLAAPAAPAAPAMPAPTTAAAGPSAPAPVKDMVPVQAGFDEARAKDFPAWKTAVEAAEGNK